MQETKPYAEVSGTITSPGGTVSVRITTVDPEPPTKRPWYKRLKGRGKQALAFVSGWFIDKVVSWGLDGLWEAVLEALPQIFGRRRQPTQA